MKVTFFIIIGLVVVFIAINLIWRNLQKKRKEAERLVEYEDPKYIELEEEKKRIRRKREELELDHPYQKTVSYKIRYEEARQAGKEEDMEKYRDAIERIKHEYNADEVVLARAYKAQIDAMGMRLAQIEMEQRLIKIKAKKII